MYRQLITPPVGCVFGAGLTQRVWRKLPDQQEHQRLACYSSRVKVAHKRQPKARKPVPRSYTVVTRQSQCSSLDSNQCSGFAQHKRLTLDATPICPSLLETLGAEFMNQLWFIRYKFYSKKPKNFKWFLVFKLFQESSLLTLGGQKPNLLHFFDIKLSWVSDMEVRRNRFWQRVFCSIEKVSHVSFSFQRHWLELKHSRIMSSWLPWKPWGNYPT